MGIRKTFEAIFSALSVADYSKVLAFASKCMQAMSRTCKGYIDTMLDGRSPTIERATDAFFTKRLQAALGRLLYYSEQGSSAASKKKLVGSEAVRANFQAVLSSSTDELLYHDLQSSFTFAFQLITKDRQKLQKVRSKHKAMFNLKERTHALEAVRIEPAWRSAVSARRLVKASVVT
jgi:hypothetical protein